MFSRKRTTKSHKPASRPSRRPALRLEELESRRLMAVVGFSAPGLAVAATTPAALHNPHLADVSSRLAAPAAVQTPAAALRAETPVAAFGISANGPGNAAFIRAWETSATPPSNAAVNFQPADTFTTDVSVVNTGMNVAVVPANPVQGPLDTPTGSQPGTPAQPPVATTPTTPATPSNPAAPSTPFTPSTPDQPRADQGTPAPQAAPDVAAGGQQQGQSQLSAPNFNIPAATVPTVNGNDVTADNPALLSVPTANVNQPTSQINGTATPATTTTEDEPLDTAPLSRTGEEEGEVIFGYAAAVEEQPEEVHSAGGDFSVAPVEETEEQPQAEPAPQARSHDGNFTVSWLAGGSVMLYDLMAGLMASVFALGFFRSDRDRDEKKGLARRRPQA